MKFMTLLSLFVAYTITPSLGYNVLCIFPVPSKSHNHLARGIVDALLQAGHKVTLATPYPDQKAVKNLRYIDVSEAVKIVDGIDMTRKRDRDMSFVITFAMNISTIAASNKHLREVLVKEQFDAVLTEYFFSDLPAGYAAVQQVPWIMLNGITMTPNLEFLVDEVRSVSTIPFVMSDATIPMNFWERLTNTFLSSMILYQSWKQRSDISDQYHTLFSPLAKARGVTLEPFSTAVHNTSIVFLNSHPSISPAYALPPNVIEVAGYHINEDTPPLPKDLQELLDSSPGGVVYFSMGSVVKSSALPLKTRQDLLKVLGELPYTVLWKFEEKIEGLPKNVHTRPWMPQPSILAHPNVKLFITHGGMLSTLEAVHHGVPLLAVPVFGDQPSNAARAVRSGYALSVPYDDDLAPKLKETLNKMLSDDRYYNKAKYLSKLFRARPVSQKKLIAYYIELAIESKGAYHLRSNSRFYSWYQRMMLDQLAAVLLVLYLVYYVLKRIAIKLFGKKKKEDLDKRKSKKNK